MKHRLTTVLAIAFLSLSVPALAEGSGTQGVDPSSFAIRVGLGSDPDQIIGGVNFLETEIANNLYLEPNAELGVGDDHLIVSATAPFHYRFQTSAKVQPYAGGGVIVGLDRVDKKDKDDTNLEISLRATGGLFFNAGNTEMFAEVSLIFGDLHDIQVMVGWRF